MNEFVILFYLFMALTALYIFVKIAIVRKRMQIEKKKFTYEKMLKQARVTRVSYIRLLETADTYKLKLDTMRDELHAEKAKLNRLRADLRELLADIRQRLQNPKPDKVEANVIVQKKIALGEHWKVLNNFRKAYNKQLAAFRLVENESRLHSSKTAGIFSKWEKEKSSLMNLYDELSAVIKLPDPRAMLSTSN